MKNLAIILITAITVSLDSFVAGFSLSLNKRQSTLLPAAVALITLLLCLVTSFVGGFLSQFAQQYINWIGAALLLLLAVINIADGKTESARLDDVTPLTSVTIGIAVGMDAAIANLSLTLNGIGLVAPIVFSAMHYLSVWLGQILANKIVIAHTNVISACILTVLAVVKLL